MGEMLLTDVNVYIGIKLPKSSASEEAKPIQGNRSALLPNECKQAFFIFSL
jgi:hypothetical protein